MENDSKHFRTGDLCLVKDEIWRDYLLRNSKDYEPFKLQPITGMTITLVLFDYELKMLEFSIYDS